MKAEALSRYCQLKPNPPAQVALQNTTKLSLSKARHSYRHLVE
jgi:hypothetical protein